MNKTISWIPYQGLYRNGIEGHLMIVLSMMMIIIFIMFIIFFYVFYYYYYDDDQHATLVSTLSG